MSQAPVHTLGPDGAGRLPGLLRELPAGAVVELLPGRYDVNLVVRRALTLRGRGAPEEVILDGKGRGSVIRVEGEVGEVRVERLTVKHGAAVLGGGGIHFDADGELQLGEVAFRRNHADDEAPGAGLAIVDGRATIERCRFVANHGRSGAAIAVHGGAVVRLVASLVVENQGAGAAVSVREAGQLFVERSTLAQNRTRAILEALATRHAAPSVVASDSILSGRRLATARPRLPGLITAVRCLLDGDGGGLTDGGGNRRGEPGFVGDGAEPYRPRRGSEADGIALPGGGPDLAGLTSGTTAGALAAG